MRNIALEMLPPEAQATLSNPSKYVSGGRSYNFQRGECGGTNTFFKFKSKNDVLDDQNILLFRLGFRKPPY